MTKSNRRVFLRSVPVVFAAGVAALTIKAYDLEPLMDGYSIPVLTLHAGHSIQDREQAKKFMELFVKGKPVGLVLEPGDTLEIWMVKRGN